MITEERFRGGAIYEQLSGDKQLHLGSERVQCLDPQTSTRIVYMPDARKLRLGGPHFVILNLSGSVNLDIRGYGSATPGTLAPGYAAVMWLYLNDTAAGSWKYQVRLIDTSKTLYYA